MLNEPKQVPKEPKVDTFQKKNILSMHVMRLHIHSCVG